MDHENESWMSNCEGAADRCRWRSCDGCTESNLSGSVMLSGKCAGGQTKGKLLSQKWTGIDARPAEIRVHPFSLGTVPDWCSTARIVDPSLAALIRLPAEHHGRLDASAPHMAIPGHSPFVTPLNPCTLARLV